MFYSLALLSELALTVLCFQPLLFLPLAQYTHELLGQLGLASTYGCQLLLQAIQRALDAGSKAFVGGC